MGPKPSNRESHDASKLYPRISYFEPICCWSCGHYLGMECRECQSECYLPEHQTPEFRGRLRKCNGLAFDCDAETLAKIRSTKRPEPFPPNGYALVNGKQMYVHHTLNGRVYCNLDEPCDHCGMTH